MDTVAHTIEPGDIDLAFVPRLVPELEVASVGDDQIVIGGATRLVVLNPTAALLFQFLDGAVSLAELVDDFTDALGVDRGVVEADVLAFARELGANGLLDGVALPAPEMPEGWDDRTAPEPMALGGEFDDFTLPDLDGSARSLSDFRGRRVLLVNWSPDCGFCVKIVDELAALHPRLDEHGVELVFVTVGDAAANRAVFEGGGLETPTLLRAGTDVDVFRGTGTPAAYLIDEEGRLAEAMVVGADQVPVLARDLAGVDPGTAYGVADPGADANESDGTENDDAGDGPRGQYLPAPGAMCGPGGGGSGANGTKWAGTRAYGVGDYHVGLRYDTPSTADALDRLFPGARINDRRVPDNYSIALDGAHTTKGAGRSRSLKLLVHGSTQLVRSRSDARVLAGLLQYLSADLEPADPSLMRVNATAMLHGDDALLLPPGLVQWLKQLQPRLARAGLRMVDTPRTLVDLATRELVVPEPTVAHDPAVLADLDDGVNLGTELPWVPPGRYRVRQWFVTRGSERRGRLSPAIGVTATLPMVFGLDDLRRGVDALGDLFQDVEPYGVWYDNAGALVEQVSAARSATNEISAPRSA